MTQDPHDQTPPGPDEPIYLEPPVPPPLPPPVIDYGHRAQATPPGPRTTPLSFTLRALGGFVLFFVTVFVAAWIGSLFGSGIAFFTVFAVAFAGLVVVSFILHRRGYLTGWLTGFLLAAAFVGFIFYTCRNGWN